jgi:hypothetical protein
VPIYTDDFSMHAGDLDYEDWASDILGEACAGDFIAVGLHDCYADHWLPQYPDLLARLGELGELRTLDEVAAEVALAGGA